MSSAMARLQAAHGRELMRHHHRIYQSAVLTSFVIPCRRELGQMSSAMARLQAEHVEERAQLQTAEDAASKLQESCEETESLRTRQADLAERITLMQTLLEASPPAYTQVQRMQREFSAVCSGSLMSVALRL